MSDTKNKKKTNAKRRRVAGSTPALTLWSSTIESTQDLLAGVRFAKKRPSAQSVAAAEEGIRKRLAALAAPVRAELYARRIGG